MSPTDALIRESTRWQPQLEALLASKQQRGFATADRLRAQRGDMHKLALASRGAIDYQTMERALHATGIQMAVAPAVKRYAVVSDVGTPPTAALLCLDVRSMGGIRSVIEWIDSNREELQRRVLIAAVGPGDSQLSDLVGRVRAIFSRPAGTGSVVWMEAIHVVMRMIKREPILKARIGTSVGGVSREEFLESVLRANQIDE